MNVTDYIRRSSSETQAAQALKIIMGTEEVDIRSIPAYRDAIEVAAESYADDVAVNYPNLYPQWNENAHYDEGKRVRGSDGKLYKCRQSHDAQADWCPEIAVSLWTCIDVDHAGTAEEPIPYDGNMALESGKYYIQNGVTYLCTRDTINPVYNDLAELVGLYVEKA